MNFLSYTIATYNQSQVHYLSITYNNSKFNDCFLSFISYYSFIIHLEMNNIQKTFSINIQILSNIEELKYNDNIMSVLPTTDLWRYDHTLCKLYRYSIIPNATDYFIYTMYVDNETDPDLVSLVNTMRSKNQCKYNDEDIFYIVRHVIAGARYNALDLLDPNVILTLNVWNTLTEIMQADLITQGCETHIANPIPSNECSVDTNILHLRSYLKNSDIETLRHISYLCGDTVQPSCDSEYILELIIKIQSLCISSNIETPKNQHYLSIAKILRRVPVYEKHIDSCINYLDILRAELELEFLKYKEDAEMLP